MASSATASTPTTAPTSAPTSTSPTTPTPASTSPSGSRPTPSSRPRASGKTPAKKPPCSSGKIPCPLSPANAPPPISSSPPKPTHTPDGKTLTACWSNPADLYARLANELGPFPLHKYWSPLAGIESSEWIAKAAERVWRREKPDLQLVYIPHLDYNLQRSGPNGEMILRDLAEVDRLLAPLAERVRADGGLLIIAGDYGISPVTTAILPNLALREAGLLATKTDATGKLLVDYAASPAFALCDHQIAHVYTRNRKEEIVAILHGLPGVKQVLATRDEMTAAGLDHARSGDVLMVAEPSAWFAHDWWKSDDEKPAWQFSVDIHNKPGFDPRELFFDPARKCVMQELAVVNGSHGAVGAKDKWPVVLSDAALPSPEMRAVDFAAWLKGLMA